MHNTIKPLIIAEHASENFGGEAVLPVHYFRQLRARGINAHLLVHERTRDELDKLPDAHAIHYIEEIPINTQLFKLAQFLPDRIGSVTVGMAMRLVTQFAAKKRAKQLIRQHGFTIVHQPIPVSPKEPSMLYGMGVPVVIGPMNGSMYYPAGFKLESKLSAALFSVGRSVSSIFHSLLPGKLRAEVLLVANDRTAKALPPGIQGKVMTLVENGVILDKWKDNGVVETNAIEANAIETNKTDQIKFIFIGRLVDWKGVNYLLQAFAQVAQSSNAALEIVGHGAERDRLEQLAMSLGIGNRVNFSGWLSQSECARRLAASDVLVLPSLLECGGAVVLEAMAMRRAVIATNHGGPIDYINSDCGILVNPETPDKFVTGLAEAMLHLVNNPSLCQSMGIHGYQRVVREFDWERKIDRILEIYAIAQSNMEGEEANEPIDSINREHTPLSSGAFSMDVQG